MNETLFTVSRLEAVIWGTLMLLFFWRTHRNFVFWVKLADDYALICEKWQKNFLAVVEILHKERASRDQSGEEWKNN